MILDIELSHPSALPHIIRKSDLMIEKTECQETFEHWMTHWNLDYERDDSGNYVNEETKLRFGNYQLGWNLVINSKE